MNQIRFDKRVVVVTGAGGGLGRSYALELARLGASVVVNDMGGDPHGAGGSRVADKVVDEIRASGGKAVANYSSVTTRQGGEDILRTAIDAFGRLDALINNAGILRNRMFENLDDEDIDRVIDVHLKAAFYVSQPAYRVMQKQNYGRILFTSSASGAFGLQSQSNYGAAKAGLIGLSNVLAHEGKPYGIQCNALLPRAATRLDHAVGDEYNIMGDIPEGTELLVDDWGPDSVTPLAVYLVSEACQATHGIYSAFAGRYARTFIGVAPGWYNTADRPASVDEIAAHWPEVEARTGFSEPLSVMDEFRPVIELARQKRRATG